jgi:predicted dehydrogenase
VLRQVFGEVTEARATTASIHDDLPPADTLAACLEFESGAVASLSLTFAAGAPWTSALRVTGTDGALEVTRDRLELHVRGDRRVETFAGPTGVRDELLAFAAAVRVGALHRNTPADALADLRVMEALLRDAGALPDAL